VVYLLVGAALLALLVWAGRRPVQTTRAVRLSSGLLAGLAAVGAVVSGLRGAWIISLALVGVSPGSAIGRAWARQVPAPAAAPEP
jgi:ABC-type uncharacterized transport system YnjBCD permease subunit